MVAHDPANKDAVFKSVIDVINKDGNVQVFHAYGDASQENCAELVKKHYIRMAETRAIARALRWATNNAQTAKEETEKGELSEEFHKEVDRTREREKSN
jgi:methylthioribose-1-phosphate isomerase